MLLFPPLLSVLSPTMPSLLAISSPRILNRFLLPPNSQVLYLLRCPSDESQGSSNRFGFIGGSFTSNMDFVRDRLVENDELRSRKNKHDFAHFLLTRKKTTVTVTDVAGIEKLMPRLVVCTQMWRKL
ncbi:hypothetical protein FCM35_KLT14109 [Carex littledalei]|uniref:Uncharacterized protein n=1 Tax=Carex littledalei TaxID=544730 RepID=A0A833QLK2_9POAL|nr:hypothetical protein FCM35_KLT14109 [Carex littledalei]